MGEDKVCVLVVDDDPEMTETVKMMLGQAGYDVYRAHNGADGLKLIHRANPQVIVCDVKMPEIDGLEVIAILKENKATAHIPIVLTTSTTEPDAYATAPVQAFLWKPFGPEELKSTVDRLANRPQP